LLVTDVGGTLTGGSRDGLKKLYKQLDSDRSAIILAYSSGRSLPLILEEIEDHQLIVPDYIISSVGTEIHRLPGEHPLDEWYRYIRQGFDRDQILEYILENYPQLEPQPEENQGSLKISFFWKEALSQELEEVRLGLMEAGLPCQIIYSSNNYLDVIPERAGKGPAVKFLIDSLSLTPNQVFVCGDSGNDINLFQYGFQGIVVANASHELKEAVHLRAYFSHDTYADGLLEGLNYYKFFNPPSRIAKPDIAREALERAIIALRRNITPLGFSAASLADNPLADKESNYFAVWSRDGIMTGLWSLCLNDSDLTECFRKTLLLLAEHQTESGQIPANVQIKTGIPDYSGVGDIASIDSVLWFVIGVSRYASYTSDLPFLQEMYPHIRKSMAWLRAHDSNNNGFLELPESSDWMDLFPRSYNVLYDEVLWYQACRDYSVLCEVMGDKPEEYSTLAETVKSKIVRQFWPTAEKLSESRESFSQTQFTLGDAQYLLSEISPFGFSWRCDVYANLLANLVGILDGQKSERLFHFLWGVGVNTPLPIKCLYPPIFSGASDWKDYFVTNFLNLPDHYHNGGIWPFIGGLWVRFLTQIGRTELAHQELDALAEACRRGVYDEWEFNEWLHGLTGRPMGKAYQAWSAASYVSAYQALRNDTVQPDFEPLSTEMFK